MKHTGTLVVGQGIAGSLVAYLLHRQGLPFVVMDAAHEHAASVVAAGMFTPISGKRKTIHSNTIEHISFAVNIYRQIETMLDLQLIHHANIYQVFSSLQEQQDLTVKSAEASYAELLNMHPLALNGLQQPFGAAEILRSGWLDCAAFIDGMKHWLKATDRLLEEKLDYNLLDIGPSSMRYRDLHFDKMIFCEGFQGRGNPFFDPADIIPCKGDVLTIRYKNSFDKKIVKKTGIYLVPGGQDLYKVGATYRWSNDSTSPAEEARKELSLHLDGLLQGKYEITEHKSGIRPTTRGRTVIAERHSTHQNMFRLNGLGTKGVIQGPWWANELVNNLLTTNFRCQI